MIFERLSFMCVRTFYLHFCEISENKNFDRRKFSAWLFERVNKLLFVMFVRVFVDEKQNIVERLTRIHKSICANQTKVTVTIVPSARGYASPRARSKSIFYKNIIRSDRTLKPPRSVADPDFDGRNQI